MIKKVFKPIAIIVLMATCATAFALMNDDNGNDPNASNSISGYYYVYAYPPSDDMVKATLDISCVPTTLDGVEKIDGDGKKYFEFWFYLSGTPTFVTYKAVCSNADGTTGCIEQGSYNFLHNPPFIIITSWFEKWDTIGTNDPHDN